MKIVDVTVGKEEMENGEIGLCLRATLENGKQLACGSPWRNRLGLWASDSDARDPAEIVALLRLFAQSLERGVKETKAA